MGAGLLHASRDHITRHQILTHVAGIVREAVNYAVPEETGMHYMDRIETDWPFRIQLPVGTNVPFHCTASGKCFMASLSRGARVKFVAGLHLERLTDQTYISSDLLLEELARVAKQGYAIDDEEFMDGMRAIAVPVTDDRNRFVASLAVHGPSQRLSVDVLKGRYQVLCDAADRLKHSLFD
jgi:DNA-binding IclR family transcriptional regulator